MQYFASVPSILNFYYAKITQMPKKYLTLFFKFFSITVSVLIISFTISFFLMQDNIKNLSINQSTEILASHNNYLSSMKPNGNNSVLYEYAKKHGIRITYISKAGIVLFDSDNDASKMENHSNRPEVIEALKNSKGSSIRHSDTMKKDMLYLAWATQNNILRTSIVLKDITKPIQKSIRKLLLLHMLIFAVTIGILFKTTQTITIPLKNLTASITTLGKTKKTEQLKITNNDEIGILTDAFNKMAKQISEDMEELTRLENFRKEFIANASHELKTPITTINGFIETLQNGALEDPNYNQKFLNIIKKNTDRLDRLVEDMLKLSSLENIIGEESEVNVLSVLNSLGEEMNLNEKVTLKIDKNCKNLIVLADKKDLFLAMQNYIDNALKYCPNETIEIIIKKLKGNIYFAVKDNGPGIDKKFQDRLFERFYRPDKNRSREIGGTGLGLSIVKNVIKKYGGEVGIESEANKGAIFYFTLPLIKT